MNKLKNGFIVTKNLYNTTELFKYTESKINDPYQSDNQSPGAPSFYFDVEMSKVHIDLLPKIEKQTGLKLYPTYNYYRIRILH